VKRYAGWAGLAFLLVAPVATAQSYRARYMQRLEPRALRLQLTEIETGLYAEGTHEDTTSLVNGRTFTYERIFFGPSLSLGAQGSVYHPNLFSFQLALAGSYGWAEQRTQSTGGSASRENWQVFGSHRFTAQILPEKPLNGSIYSNSGRSYREYDYFTRATVDTLGYGARVAYIQPALNLMAAYTHTQEELTDTTVPYETQQDLVNFDARHEHSRGGSALNYTFNQFAYSRGPTVLEHVLGLSDSEQLTSRLGLGLGASVSRHESQESAEHSYSGNLGLNWQPAQRWAGDATFSYDRFENPDVTSQAFAGRASLQHQLYDSLFSAWGINGSWSESTADQDSGYTRQYGGVWSENYTKRLGTAHRLTIYGSVALNHTEQKSTGLAVNESHAFPVPPADETFFLSQFGVDLNSVVVTDTNQVFTYTRDIDYELFVNGSLTGVRRLPGSSISTGATVLVDYHAEPTPGGSYETIAESGGLRLDLWKNLLGLYARVSRVDNNASSEIHTLNSTSYAVGGDLNWHWFRAGVEYQAYDSNESTYWSARAYQAASFTLDPLSSVSAGFNESYAEYAEAGREEQNYSFTANYHRLVGQGIRADLRGGVAWRLSTDVDQTVAVLRPEVTFNYGRTSIRLDYSFEYNLYADSEERLKHLLTLRLQRRF
jgi:hypothetical protein